MENEVKKKQRLSEEQMFFGKVSFEITNFG